MQSRPRQGFTLVEMMVVVALTMFIMLILSTAFSTALETFRQLKAIGDMQDQLRTATNMLRTDLAADHFEGKRRLSDLNFSNPLLGVGPPREGFFRLTQTSAPLVEGLDADNLPSRRATGCVLHFTVKRRGRNASDFFSAPVPDPNSPLLSLTAFPNPDGRFQDPGSNVFNSQWVEVVYFLGPAMTAGGTQANANGIPLWGLYRQQRVVVPDPSALNSTNQINAPAYSTSYLNAFSCFLQNGTQPLYFNSPSSLTIPQNRLGMKKDAGQPQPSASYILPIGVPNPTPNALQPRMAANGTYTGDDLVMTNVVSFDVQVLSPNLTSNPSSNSTGLADVAVPSGYNQATTLPFFDTWSSIQDELGANYSDPNSIPKYVTAQGTTATITIQGLQITLRVWDARTQQTRQVTIFQEM
jgi:type II secretory pathway pseudopilin PulG